MRNHDRLSAEQLDSAAYRRRRRESRERWTGLAIVAAVVLVADQIVKILVRSTMERGESRTVLPFLDLTRATNEGIAFGLFPGRQDLVAALTVVALVAIAVALAGLVRRDHIAALGTGLLLGGAFGNLFDRVVHGGVTDFIDLPHFPAFNVADIGITLGAAFIMLGFLRTAEDDDLAEEHP